MVVSSGSEQASGIISCIYVLILAQLCQEECPTCKTTGSKRLTLYGHMKTSISKLAVDGPRPVRFSLYQM